MDSERFTGLIMVVGGGFLLYWFVSGKLPAFAYAIKTGAMPNIQNPNSTVNTSAPSTASATINTISGLGTAIGGIIGASQNAPNSQTIAQQAGIGGVVGATM